MRFQVSDDCYALGLRARGMVFRGVRIGPRDAALQAEITATAAELRARFPDPAQIRSLPEVVAFQELLRSVGVNPRRLQPSVERLLTTLLKRGDLPAINNFVDAYNLLSVRSLCSLGAHDLAVVVPPVTLRRLRQEDTFTPLGSPIPETVRPGEYGYVAGDGQVLCRLDVLQADYSKVTFATTNVLLILEATSQHLPHCLPQLQNEAAEHLCRYVGGCSELLPGSDPEICEKKSDDSFDAPRART